jgi:hypothetical protein
VSRRRRSPWSVPFEPILLTELELTDPSTKVIDWHANSKDYRRARALVRLDGAPLGTVDVARGESIEACLGRTFGRALRAHQAEDGRRHPNAVAAAAPLVTVVIATRERPRRLATTLDSVLELDYSTYEVVVVDNAPRTPDTRQLLEQRYVDAERLRHVREPQRGLASAHNRGLREARGEIVAFTDDDVKVDPRWLLELVRAFGWADDVACVTGLILPAELETPSQLWLDEHVRLNKGFEPKLFGARQALPVRGRSVRVGGQHGLPHRGTAVARRIRPCHRRGHPLARR